MTVLVPTHARIFHRIGEALPTLDTEGLLATCIDPDEPLLLGDPELPLAERIQQMFIKATRPTGSELDQVGAPVLASAVALRMTDDLPERAAHAVTRSLFAGKRASIFDQLGHWNESVRDVTRAVVSRDPRPELESLIERSRLLQQAYRASVLILDEESLEQVMDLLNQLATLMLIVNGSYLIGEAVRYPSQEAEGTTWRLAVGVSYLAMAHGLQQPGTLVSFQHLAKVLEVPIPYHDDRMTGAYHLISLDAMGTVVQEAFIENWLLTIYCITDLYREA